MNININFNADSVASLIEAIQAVKELGLSPIVQTIAPRVKSQFRPTKEEIENAGGKVAWQSMTDEEKAASLSPARASEFIALKSGSNASQSNEVSGEVFTGEIDLSEAPVD